MTKNSIRDLSRTTIKNLKNSNLDFFVDDPLLTKILSAEKDDESLSGAWNHINQMISNYQKELVWISGEIRPDFYGKEQPLHKYYDGSRNLIDIDFIPEAIAEQTTAAVLENDSYCLNKAVARIYPYYRILYNNDDRYQNIETLAGRDSDGDSNTIPRSWNGYFYNASNNTWIRKTETSAWYDEQSFLSSVNYTNMITAFTDFKDGSAVSSFYNNIVSNGITLFSTSYRSPPTGDFFIFNQTTSVFAKVHISYWTGTEGHPGSAGPPPTSPVPGDWNATLTVYYGNGLISGNVPTGTYVLSNGLPLFTDTQKASNYTSSIMFYDYEYKYVKAGFISMFDAWFTLFKSPFAVYKKLYDWMNNSSYIKNYNGLSSEVTNLNSIYNFNLTPTNRYINSALIAILSLFTTRQANRITRTALINTTLGSVRNIKGRTTTYTSSSGLYKSRYQIGLVRYNKLLGKNSTLFLMCEAKNTNNKNKDQKRAEDEAVSQLLLVANIKEISEDRKSIYIDSNKQSSFTGTVYIVSDDKIQGNMLFFETKVSVTQTSSEPIDFKEGVMPNKKKTIGVQNALVPHAPLTLSSKVPWSWDTNTPGLIRLVKVLPIGLPVTG
jgi:hypothetical protein